MKQQSGLIRGAETLAVLVAAAALVAAAEPWEAGPAPQPTDTSLPIRVNNPRRLGAWQLPAERVALGDLLNRCQQARDVVAALRREM
jgi:hypothetical protein